MVAAGAHAEEEPSPESVRDLVASLRAHRPHDVDGHVAVFEKVLDPHDPFTAVREFADKEQRAEEAQQRSARASGMRREPRVL